MRPVSVERCRLVFVLHYAVQLEGPHREMTKANPVDVYVGLRVRQRRTLLGMSQTKLGQSVDLTFQQIQKYETGANRISSSRLFEFANVLHVTVPYFFAGYETGKADDVAEAARRSRRKATSKRATPDNDDSKLIKRETLELVRAFYKIRKLGVRKNIVATIKSLSGRS